MRRTQSTLALVGPAVFPQHRTSHCYSVDATVSCFPARRRRPLKTQPSPGLPLLPEPGPNRLRTTSSSSRAAEHQRSYRTASLPRRTSAVRDASSDHHRRLSPPPCTDVRRSAPGSGNFGGNRAGPDCGEEVPLFSLSLVPPQPSESHAVLEAMNHKP
ncbi:hypothetical protein U1Q18_010386 [Sarracenia purpurea var. burkii]